MSEADDGTASVLAADSYEESFAAESLLFEFTVNNTVAVTATIMTARKEQIMIDLYKCFL